MSEHTAFDLVGPLPGGTTVLEASAGTGKTYTIAALTARYVAAGVPLGRIMLVTFGNAASRELRDRVRERLVGAEAALADVGTGCAAADPVVRMLATGTAAEVAERRRLLAVALATFDSATIATTHSFCAQMLAGLGVAADRDTGATFADGVDDLVREVAGDLYLRAFAARDPGSLALSAADVLMLGREAERIGGDTELWPLDASGMAELRRRAAAGVRAETAERKRRLGLVGYDDWLVLLRDALADPVQGAVACGRVRARYDVVLVDEFQDTDPVQWEVLRLAFHGHVSLVLIGDPKQAIYAFRGGDVTTYLQAAAVAGARFTLDRNRRSDDSLLDAVGRVFDGAALGDPAIAVLPVVGAHPVARLVGAGAPLRLRQVGRRGLGRVGRANGLPSVRPVRAAVARDVAADIVRLLSGAGRLEGELVLPGDIAVLVRTHVQGGLVHAALRAADVPAVLAGGASVFTSAAAGAWLVLLEAMEQPHRSGRVRSAALTVFLGYDEVALDAAGDRVADQLGPRLRRWGDLLGERGVAAFFEVLTAEEQLPARVLSRPDGERQLTDLRHVGEALHAAAQDAAPGLTALVGWLRRRIAQAAVEGTDERRRRLESDGAAVQIMTVHGSKGLEFPVVYVPFGWDRYVNDEPSVLRLHDEAGHRVLDVGGVSSPGYAAARSAHEAEESGEELRLLYVALTRARSQVVAHWAPTANTPSAPLHRLLFGAGGPGTEPRRVVPVPSDAEASVRLAELAAASTGTIAAEVWEPRPPAVWERPPAELPALAVSRFTRTLDTAWRRTSYSALTAAAHEAVHGGLGGAGLAGAGGAAGTGGAVGAAGAVGEVDLTGLVRDDEADAPAEGLPLAGSADAQPPGLPPVPLDALPGGTSFGTLVHEVLEDLDPAALSARCAEATAWRTATIPAQALADGLRPVLHTPLGPDGLTLADVGAGDRLAELTFELPLAGGEAGGPHAPAPDLRAIAAVLRRHDLGVLSPYPDLLELLEPAMLRGYLTGSIDAVLRLPAGGAAGAPAYAIVDYKTNRLGAGVLTVWHYRQEAMVEEMLRSHYVLQALLYAVALHRFLRWRQPAYDPAVHLGPVLYLFVRGMTGPGSADGAGVFRWQAPPALVVELSDLLAGGS